MITETQKIQLRRLLAVYGRGGSHYTQDNERYITTWIERGKWNITAHPTQSCLNAVNMILNSPERRTS